jgi:hypothetical protein
MKKFFSFAAFLTAFSAFYLSAQSTVFAPIGASWRYNAYVNTTFIGGKQYRYNVTGDTLLYGKTASVIKAEYWEQGYDNFQPVESMTHYVATDGDRVLMLSDTTYYVLFDFAAQPGDTIFTKIRGGQIPFENDCATPSDTLIDFAYIIDSVGMINVAGNLLRTQYTRYVSYDYMWTVYDASNLHPSIVERVGAVLSGLWFGQLPLCLTKGWHAHLRCYQDNDLFYKGRLNQEQCNNTVAAIEPALVPVAVMPTVFSQELKVQKPSEYSNSLHFTLYNAWGIPVLQADIQNEVQLIPTGDLVPGIYFWTATDGRRILASGKVAKME